MSEMKIILEPNQPPQLIGIWTVGDVLRAADFLRAWIEQQQISLPPPPAEQQ